MASLDRGKFVLLSLKLQILFMLSAISPVDGRYAAKTAALSEYCSEAALIRYRLKIELDYFAFLAQRIPQLSGFPAKVLPALYEECLGDHAKVAIRVKELEKTTNHDVKAVEYFLREVFDRHGLENYKEFIHFGLTSQDVNNTAFPAMMKDALEQVWIPIMEQVRAKIESMAAQWALVPMLARTHGQPASPTTMGKELKVFSRRLEVQLATLKQIPHSAKFGGATGNFNAHHAAYPEIDWHTFAVEFVEGKLGLSRSHPTTQIEHYDNFAAQCHALARIHTILTDACRDIWQYISMDYFKQEVIAGEVGSSAMPHKVNPIDFENAEGNFGIANAMLEFLAAKLPVSRLQRDLTDSTVLRNFGVPLAHSAIGLQSMLKGLSKLSLNETVLYRDLENHWIVVTEGIQTILRREGISDPYNLLKMFSRGKGALTEQDIMRFIEQLDVSEHLKTELKKLSPHNYFGIID